MLHRGFHEIRLTQDNPRKVAFSIEWRHFLTLRTSNSAHPQMREIANMILSEFKSKLPVIFEDISNEN